jgi:hypothetical protein
MMEARAGPPPTAQDEGKEGRWVFARVQVNSKIKKRMSEERGV